jgi:hypothetical protein
VTRDQHGRRVALRRRAADLVVEQSVEVPVDRPIILRVTCNGETYDFSATQDGRELLAGSGAAKLLGSEVAPGFGSVRVGLMAHGDGRGTATFTDIERENVG